MKHFFYKILVFGLPLLLLTFALDLFISNNLKLSNNYHGEYEVWNDIYKGDIKAEVAIYGSSRAWVQISPEILKDSLNKDVYNFGIDGNTFPMQYLRHLEYIKVNQPPKHIIIAVDFNSFKKKKDLYMYKQFLPYMLWNKNIKTHTQSYNGFRSLDYSLPLFRYLGKNAFLKKNLNIGLFSKTKENYRINGYRGMDKTWTNDFDKAKKKMSSYKIKIDPETLKLFELFLTECSKKEIKVTLVYTPEYIEGQHFIEDRNQVIDIFKSLANKYKINFIDFSQNAICLNKDLFYNTTHLNKTGSELFSRLLVHDLLELKKNTSKSIE